MLAYHTPFDNYLESVYDRRIPTWWPHKNDRPESWRWHPYAKRHRYYRGSHATIRWIKGYGRCTTLSKMLRDSLDPATTPA